MSVQDLNKYRCVRISPCEQQYNTIKETKSVRVDLEDVCHFCGNDISEFVSDYIADFQNPDVGFDFPFEEHVTEPMKTQIELTVEHITNLFYQDQPEIKRVGTIHPHAIFLTMMMSGDLLNRKYGLDYLFEVFPFCFGSLMDNDVIAEQWFVFLETVREQQQNVVRESELGGNDIEFDFNGLEDRLSGVLNMRCFCTSIDVDYSDYVLQKKPNICDKCGCLIRIDAQANLIGNELYASLRYLSYMDRQLSDMKAILEYSEKMPDKIGELVDINHGVMSNVEFKMRLDSLEDLFLSILENQEFI